MYSHPAFPLLGFVYPGGWQPFTTNIGALQEIGGGIIVSFSNIMIRVGNHTALIDASVTPFPGLPNSSVRTQVLVSPTAEFPDRAIDTFLAIDWQMLIGTSDNLFDRDGDG